MLIEKYTSIKPIIEKVYIDTDYQMEIPFEDLIIWAVDAMDLLGYPLTYVPKVMGKGGDPTYDFTNYRIQLPCDFHRLEAVAVDGATAYHATDSFHQLMDGACCGFDNVSSATQDIFLTAIASYSPQADPITPQMSNSPVVTFSINDNFITFNKQKGEACIAYKAFPVDDDGFPLIPDNAKYIRFITTYLIWKLDHRLWRAGYISEKVYRESKDEYLWAAGSASSALKMPSVAQWESMKQAFFRLIPQINSYGNNFKDQLTKNGRL